MCLSRTASVGYVVVTAKPMATSQDFVNWTCGEELAPEFLQYLLIAEGDGLLRFSSGAVHKTIYFPEVKAFHICVPSVAEQRRIVATLSEAFEGIATVKANAEKSMQNAHDLFESLRTQMLSAVGSDWVHVRLREVCDIARGGSPRPINEFLTSDSSGVNWVKISDATASKKYIFSTVEKIRPAGISRSRLVQDGDFLLSNSMSFGRPYIMRTTGCIHDGWLVLSNYKDTFHQDFLYLLLGSNFVYRQFDHLAAGSTVRNLNKDLAGSVLVPVPPLEAQIEIAAALDELSKEIDRLSEFYRKKSVALDELRKSLLQQAFIGQLPASQQTTLVLQPPSQITTFEFAANVIALAHARHERQKREKTFGHVKEQKVLHLVESIAKIDLGRQPMRDAAGPNDFQHMLRAEEWAKAHSFFDMVKRGEGYEFRKLSAFDERMSNARQVLEPWLPQLERVIDLVVPMDTEEAEVLATVHAAWNNLLIDGIEVSDDAIVSAAREDWHADKLKIPEHKFRSAIELIREKGIVPDGTAKYVGGQQSLI